MASIIVLCILMLTFVMNKKLWIFEEEPKEVTVFNEMIIEQASDGHLVYLTDGEVIKPNPVLNDIEHVTLGHDGGGLGLKDKWDCVNPSIKYYETTKDLRSAVYSSPVYQNPLTDEGRQFDTGQQRFPPAKQAYTNLVHGNKEHIPFRHDAVEVEIKNKGGIIDPSIWFYGTTKDIRPEIYSNPVYENPLTDKKTQLDTCQERSVTDKQGHINPVLEPDKKVNNKLKENDKKNKKGGFKNNKEKLKNDKKSKDEKEKKAGSGCHPISLGYSDLGVLLLTLM